MMEFWSSQSQPCSQRIGKRQIDDEDEQEAGFNGQRIEKCKAKVGNSEREGNFPRHTYTQKEE